ncbi:uncharacterized protein with NRDE domain [Pullulanibacillus pueri]|uniref:NRDE family protein n=1 Tax=Pullulanibacillus pueri TaxID=1437324 RepID=A0A8J3A274_9BACL|nr:NRDE family protein [Pullulanibacillus pueri]MBM7682013.1 uncharacterized protein with NRDE domain [Pullulanibacillus pueri]GGH88225.1 hypothetical protein GCM10007096_40070 [Pullulanibacillus pueri]
MCLITFAYNMHSSYSLVVASNRDEFYGRPTATAHFWEDHPVVLAGRDLQMMGTWMGVTKTGRFAAITNYRDPFAENKKVRSRGELVSDFLTSSIQPEDYMKEISARSQEYNGFNLIVADCSSLYYFSNREEKIRKLDAGIYGLSNALLDTPWPKVEKSKKRLKECLESKGDIDEEALFQLLADERKAEVTELPDTGIDHKLEHLLSSAFIQSQDYGTRTSTVVTITTEGHLSFRERTFMPERKNIAFDFKIQDKATQF